MGLNDTLYVSNYTSGTLSVIKVHENGMLNGPVQIIQFNINDEEIKNKKSHVHEVTIGDKCIFVNDLGKDSIYRFEVNSNGLLSDHPSHITILSSIGCGPRHLIIHPFAPFAFTINELNNTITSFSFNRQECLILDEIITISSLRAIEDNISMGAAEIQISKNGKYLYGSNRDLSDPHLNRNSIVVFEIDLSSGFLSYLQHVNTEGIHPRYFNLFLDDSFLLVGNMRTNTIISFPVDQCTGLIGTPVSQVNHLSPTHIISYTR